jgi:hypothetical protein
VLQPIDLNVDGNMPSLTLPPAQKPVHGASSLSVTTLLHTVHHLRSYRETCPNRVSTTTVLLQIHLRWHLCSQRMPTASQPQLPWVRSWPEAMSATASQPQLPRVRSWPEAMSASHQRSQQICRWCSVSSSSSTIPRSISRGSHQTSLHQGCTLNSRSSSSCCSVPSWRRISRACSRASTCHTMAQSSAMSATLCRCELSNVCCRYR